MLKNKFPLRSRGTSLDAIYVVGQLRIKNPFESLYGTTVINTISLTKGASILRVHDVKEAVQAVKLFNVMNDSIGQL